MRAKALVGDLAPDLEELVRGELFEPADPVAKFLADEILCRHGDAVAAILFYGSCLRRHTSEGVLDFYVVVDSYRAAYRSRALAWANAVLPPNVFYLEIETALGTLRAKYAVMSMRDFSRGAKPGGLRSGIWARFCQPALAVSVRDDPARKAIVAAVADAIVTAVARTLPLLASADGVARFTAEALWQRALHETYAAELRPEGLESVRGLYDANPARYEHATRAALARLHGDAYLQVNANSDIMETTLPPGSQAPAAYSRNLRRLLAKGIYFLQLLKTAATFGDWLPYALWKLERHTGKKIVPSERQRRRPFIWGWPLLFQILWRKDLR